MDRPRSLWLVGPSRIGKTEWARSLGPHIYWNGSIDLASFIDYAQYAIFDDFKWEYLPFKKQFFGAQKEFTMTDKYRKKRTVKWGKPSILIVNPEDDFYDRLDEREKQWWIANVFYYETFLNFY